MLEPKRLRTQVASIVEPDDIHVSWFDISNPDAPVLKIYYDGAWRPIGGGEGPSGTAESTANKVTEISAESTDIQYPSAKAVYTALQSSAPADIFFSGTHAEVKGLRDSGTLVPGALYKITDYVATTTQEGTQSANHPFDIIVRATAPDTLSEEALASPHDGDTYFTGLGAKLEAWRLMYCIDNDADRFAWADAGTPDGIKIYNEDSQVYFDDGNTFYRTGLVLEYNGENYYQFKDHEYQRQYFVKAQQPAVNDEIYEYAYEASRPVLMEQVIVAEIIAAIPGNGKGVVYRMIDEWGNDAPYDFKGILILRDAAFWASSDAATALAENTFDTQTPGDKYLYLFSAVDSNGNILDASSTHISVVIEGDSRGVITCMENVFAGYVGGLTDDGENNYSIAGNVFLAKISDESWDYIFYVINNTFSGAVVDNTFYGDVYNNSFSGYVQGNTFTGETDNNTFSGNVERNTFSGYTQDNDFSGKTSSNAFYLDVCENVFSGEIRSNGFNTMVIQNTFSGQFENSEISDTETQCKGNVFSGIIYNLVCGCPRFCIFCGNIYNVVAGGFYQCILEGSLSSSNLGTANNCYFYGEYSFVDINQYDSFGSVCFYGSIYGTKSQHKVVNIEPYLDVPITVTSGGSNGVIIRPTFNMGIAMPNTGFEPGMLYELGAINSNTTFLLNTSLEQERDTNRYFWTFSIPSGNTVTVTWPANIRWEGGNTPTIEAGYEYHISILNGCAICSKFPSAIS